MKKYTFIFTLLFLSHISIYVSAQNNTIVNENSAWATLSYISGFWSPDYLPPWVSTTYCFLDGDSVFNGITYKKLFCCNDKQHEQRAFAGIMREENQKTFFIENNKTAEELLYDFSLSEGDSFLDFTIGKCDEVIINGLPKKRMLITYNTDLVVDTVIENIGSLQGLLSPRYYMLVGVVHKFLCYSENGAVLYHNPKYSECYYDDPAKVWANVQNIELKDLQVYPNPVYDILSVVISNEKISQIDIFDVSGRKIFNKQLNYYENKSEIAVSNFSNGLYFIKVQTEYGKTYLSKFIKK